MTSTLQRRLAREGYEFKANIVDNDSYTVSVRKDGKEVAGAAAYDVTKDRIKVSSIRVRPAEQQKKLGTVIYEIFADLACRQNKTLISDLTRSPFAEAFWRKQERKGRASCNAPNKEKDDNVYLEPVKYTAQELCPNWPELEAKKCRVRKERELLAKLPRPEVDPERGRTYWPCERYALNASACGSTLEALNVKVSKTSKKRKGRR